MDQVDSFRSSEFKRIFVTSPYYVHPPTSVIWGRRHMNPSHLKLRCLEALNRNFPAAQFWDVGLYVSLHDAFPPRDCVKPLRTRLIMVTNALRVRPHCGVTNIQLLRH